MTRTDVINEIAKCEKFGFTKAESKTVLDEILNIFAKGLARDKKLQLTGFGTFTITEIEEREGRNPRNPAETIKIGKRNQAFFRAGQELKDEINK